MDIPQLEADHDTSCLFRFEKVSSVVVLRSLILFPTRSLVLGSSPLKGSVVLSLAGGRKVSGCDVVFKPR